jgi:hypothetical protein
MAENDTLGGYVGGVLGDAAAAAAMLAATNPDPALGSAPAPVLGTPPEAPAVLPPPEVNPFDNSNNH